MERITKGRRHKSRMMQAEQQCRDIEHGYWQSSSSYGSLDGNRGLQQHYVQQSSSVSEKASTSRDNESSSMHASVANINMEPNVQDTNGVPVDTSATAALDALNDEPAVIIGSDQLQNKREPAPDVSRQNESEQHPAHKEHLVKSRQYYRDMVLGVNDGLVSTFLLVAGKKICG